MCYQLCIEKLVLLSFRRYLVEIELNYKHVSFFIPGRILLFFCTCSVVSGLVPPNSQYLFAVVRMIRRADGLSFFRPIQPTGTGVPGMFLFNGIILEVCARA